MVLPQYYEPRLEQHLSNINKAFRLKAISLLMGLAILPATAQSPSDFLSSRVRVSGATFCLYNESNPKPIVLIRLDRAYTDYERKGFFRIGALPLGVFDGITFELESSSAITNGLSEVHRWLGPQGSARIELRKVSFIVANGMTNRLTAARAQLAPGGKLALLDTVRFDSGSNYLSAARGTLQITGDKAGQLILEGSGISTNNLFTHNFAEDHMYKEKTK